MQLIGYCDGTGAAKVPGIAGRPAIRIDNGDLAWSEPMSEVPDAVGGDRGLLTDGGEVCGVSLDGGEEIWTTDVPGDINALVFSEDRIVLAVQWEIVGLAADDGDQTWRNDPRTGLVEHTYPASVSGLNALDCSTVELQEGEPVGEPTN